MADFVKSMTTDVPVVRSKGELEKMLIRYGASAFSVEQDYANNRAQVRFAIPDSLAKGAPMVPVRIPVDARKVYQALYGAPLKAGYDAKLMAQAERVAWRNLLLWVDAALSAAAIELQTITAAFFAHAVIGPQGETALQVYANDQKMLTSGREP